MKSLSYRKATDWHDPTFPKWMRFFLVIAAVLCCASCWFIQIYGSECFESFDITDSIDEKLGGKASNLVLEKGWYAIGMFFVGFFFLFIQQRAAASRAKKPEYQVTE